MITEYRVFWLLVLAGLAGFVYLLGDIMTPFIFCLVLAYMLDPMTDRLESRGMGRGLAAFVVCAGTLLILLLLMLFLLPAVISQIIDLARRLPDILAWFQLVVDEFFANPSNLLNWMLSTLSLDTSGELQAKLMVEAKATLRSLGSVLFQDTSAILNSITSNIGAIGNRITTMLLIPFILFYLVRDWDRLILQIQQMLPRSQVASARTLGVRCSAALSGFFRGQLLVVVFLGLFYGLFLALIGVPFGFLIGLFTGLFSFVPFVGMLVGFTVAEIVTFVHFGFWQELVLVAVIFVAGQAIESSVLTPKLIGDSINLHPVWIIFGLMAGGSLLGFSGLILAIPILAVLNVFVRFFFERYQNSKMYEDH